MHSARAPQPTLSTTANRLNAATQALISQPSRGPPPSANVPHSVISPAAVGEPTQALSASNAHPAQLFASSVLRPGR